MDEINWNDVIFENDKKNRSNERFFSYNILSNEAFISQLDFS